MDGTRFAVLVGNDTFPAGHPDDASRLPPLNCPAADVNGLKEILEAEQHGGYLVTPLINRPHAEARKAVYECLKKAGPQDQVLIYYSGHGKLDESGSLYLAGSDTDPGSLDPTAFAAADIQKYVGESRAAARIVILDCCFSGAVERGFLRGAAKGEVADQATRAVRGLQGNGVFYLTASTDTQTAEEKDHDRYSLLTKHIIDGIRDGQADADDDGEICFFELCRFVQDKIRLEAAQRPLAFALKAYGDPVVALTGRPALTTRRRAVHAKISELVQQDLLDGADAAELLRRIYRPAEEPINEAATVRSLIASLYAALSINPLFLRTAHEFAYLLRKPPDLDPPEQSLTPPLPRKPDEPLASDKNRPLARMIGLVTKPFGSDEPAVPGKPVAWKAPVAWKTIVSLALIGALALGALWAFHPPDRSSEPVHVTMRPAGPVAEPRPTGAPLTSGSRELITGPSGGTSLLTRPGTR